MYSNIKGGFCSVKCSSGCWWAYHNSSHKNFISSCEFLDSRGDVPPKMRRIEINSRSIAYQFSTQFAERWGFIVNSIILHSKYWFLLLATRHHLHVAPQPTVMRFDFRLIKPSSHLGLTIIYYYKSWCHHRHESTTPNFLKRESRNLIIPGRCRAEKGRYRPGYQPA